MTTHSSKSKNMISYNSVQMNNFMRTHTSNSIIDIYYNPKQIHQKPIRRLVFSVIEAYEAGQ